MIDNGMASLKLLMRLDSRWDNAEMGVLTIDMKQKFGF